MRYSVEFTIQAEEDLSRIDKAVANSITNKIEWLSQNIENINPSPLKGRFKDTYKLRIGDWRIVYSFEHSNQIITGYAVRRRSEVYRIR